MSEDDRVLFDKAGKGSICESYINPFKDCENPQKLSHIIDLIVKGKLYPYVTHGLPFVEDSNHPGTMTFEKFKLRLQEEKVKSHGESDWLIRYPQLADDAQLKEKYSELRAEAVKMGIALPKDALITGNAVYARFSGIPPKGKNLLYRNARQCYINIRRQNPELSPLPAQKTNIIEGLQEIQDLCVLTEIKQNELTGFHSVVDLAEYYGVDSEALRKRLDRYRKKHALDPDLFVESQNRGKNKPKYLYNAQRILPFIEELKNKESSDKRPTQKD